MKIYHYTSIETLALILKNRTLRFNNVSNVDDPDECQTEDFAPLQPYCFISCWTKEHEDSIPLWKIYANDGRGVRLESDTNYIQFRNGEIEIRDLHFVVKNVKLRENSSTSYFINLWQNGISVNPFFETNYSDKKRIFEKDCSTQDIQQWEYDIESAFNTKKTCWAFENEIRFILLGCKCEDSGIVNWQKIFSNIIAKKEFSEEYVDLILEQDFFDNLKITCGPRTTEAEKIIIQSLVNTYDKNRLIEISKSKIRMR